MNPGNFEVREIAGSPCQIGLRYGQSIKSGFSRIVARYAENYLKNHDSARVEVISEGMEGYLRDHAPTLIEEMAGIAEGSGVSFADVFKHNLCSCIGTTLSSEASVREAAHCTSIGFPNSNRGPLLGKNTDCGDPETSLIRFVPMLCWRPSTGLASLGLTHMRTVWRHVGVNEKGLALGGSSVMGIVQFAVFGIRKSQPDPAATARSPESPAAVMDTSQTDSPRVSFSDSLSQQAITTIFPASSPVDSL